MNQTIADCGAKLTGSLAPSDLDLVMQVALSVLVTLKVDLVGILYDNEMASHVTQLTPKLSQHGMRMVTYSTSDVTDMAVMSSYLEVISDQTASSISLVLSADVNATKGVLESVCHYKNSLGQQTAVDLHTRWLVALPPQSNTTELEDDVTALYHVAVLEHLCCQTAKKHTKDMLLVKTLMIKPEGRRFEYIGSADDCRLYLHTEVFPNVKHSFNGKHLIVGVNMWHPFIMKSESNNRTEYTGFSLDLLWELSQRLNFTYSLKEPADKGWGALRPDGKWTGIVGMLQTYEIDFSVAPIMTTVEREDVMDGTFPYYYDNVGVLYRRPDPLDTLWKTYLHPFHTLVLYCIGGALGLGTLMYAAIGIVSPLTVRKRKSNYVIGVLSEVEHGAQVLAASLVHQAQWTTPAIATRRIFLAFWWIFCIALAATYRGNLTAFLLVYKDVVPFNTLQELANQNVYKWGVIGSTVVEGLLYTSQREDFRKLGDGLKKFKAIDPEVVSLDSEVHRRKINRGQYAYISDMVPMEIWVAEDCDLRFLKETVMPLPFVVGLHNNSVYVQTFNGILLEIEQAGLYQMWKKKWWPSGGQCITGTQHGTKVVSLLQSQSAFYVLLIGLVTSILLLLLETCWNRKCAALDLDNSSQKNNSDNSQGESNPDDLYEKKTDLDTLSSTLKLKGSKPTQSHGGFDWTKDAKWSNYVTQFLTEDVATFSRREWPTADMWDTERADERSYEGWRTLDTGL